MRELVRCAPDLWSWRSGLYRLGASAAEVGELVAQLPVDVAADLRTRGETRRVLRHLVDELAGADERLELAALRRLGRVESLLGDYGEATDRFERALQIATTGDPSAQANSLLGLADTALMQGDYEQATTRYEHALQIATTLGDRQARPIASSAWPISPYARRPRPRDRALRTRFTDRHYPRRPHRRDP